MNTPMWCYLPKRDTALNLARVSRVEFHGARAWIYFDHAESHDAEYPTMITTAQLPIGGEDVAALRRALGFPIPDGD